MRPPTQKDQRIPTTPKSTEIFLLCSTRSASLPANIAMTVTWPIARLSYLANSRACYSPIADRSTLVDGTKGVEIFSGLAPAAGEHIIKKHRYSAFFGTDLDLILREWGITTVIISGTTTENCCHATARDAMFNNYKVVFLSDATGSFDYPDVGCGAMSAEEVHKATLCILAFSTAHVMTVDELKTQIERGTTAVRAKRKKAA
jgi:biuret amidohydrolase